MGSAVGRIRLIGGGGVVCSPDVLFMVFVVGEGSRILGESAVGRGGPTVEGSAVLTRISLLSPLQKGLLLQRPVFEDLSVLVVGAVLRVRRTLRTSLAALELLSLRTESVS